MTAFWLESRGIHLDEDRTTWIRFREELERAARIYWKNAHGEAPVKKQGRPGLQYRCLKAINDQIRDAEKAGRYKRDSKFRPIIDEQLVTQVDLIGMIRNQEPTWGLPEADRESVFRKYARLWELVDHKCAWPEMLTMDDWKFLKTHVPFIYDCLTGQFER